MDLEGELEMYYPKRTSMIDISTCSMNSQSFLIILFLNAIWMRSDNSELANYSNILLIITHF